MLCSACNATIADSAKFCPKCGARAEAPTAEVDSKQCPQCGTDNPVNAKFCKKDGYRLDLEVAKTENLAKPLASVPTAQVSSESIAPETPPPNPTPASDTVICPQCGTENSAKAKFCKKDGYALQAGIVAPSIAQATPTHSAQATARAAVSEESVSVVTTSGKSSKGLVIGALAGLMLLASAGGYAYWAGYIGNRQGSVQEAINAELSSHGLSSVRVTVDKEWTASLSGDVPKQADKDQALELMKSHTELKSVSADMVQVLPGTADLEQSIHNALSSKGLDWLNVTVDNEFVATISGGVAKEIQKAQAIEIAKSVAGVKDAKYQITDMDMDADAPPDQTPEVAPPLPRAEVPQPLPVAAPTVPVPAPQVQSPAGAIDQNTVGRNLVGQLRKAGLNTVIVHVYPDRSIELSGTVNSAAKRDEALHIATSIPGGNGVRENIRVIESANQQTPVVEKSMKSKKAEKQPDTAQPESQPDNATTESKPEEPAPTQQPEVPKSMKELLDNLKNIKIKPVTDADRQNKTCPIPGQSC